MNVERLNLLIATLRTVRPEEFVISTWDCGSAACAAGWYIRQNWGMGLRLAAYAMTVLDEAGRYGYTALAAHFDLSSRQTNWILAR